MNRADEQFTRLKGELEDQYQGAKNAGRPFLLEGGLKWQQIAFSPVDMEFISAKHVSAREIALAFGVPPMILGIPGDNTYANYAEANRALWRLTLLPLMEKTIAALNAWLVPQFGEDLKLGFDRDAITALTAERDALWTRLQTATFLTPNEKRAQLGFAPVDGGDELPPVGMMPPAGGGSNFFNQGSGVNNASDPATTNKSDTILECGCSGVDEVKDYGATMERYNRLLKIQKEYEKEAQANLNVTFLREWIHVSGSTYPRSYHQNVSKTGLNVPFVVGGGYLNLPCDPKGKLDNIINCRCRVEYQRLEKDAKSGIYKPASISNGNKAYLTDQEIAEIIFNEHSIMSGAPLNEAHRIVAHTIINGEEKYGKGRPDTALTFGGRKPTSQEFKALKPLLAVVSRVRQERLNGHDPVAGNIMYNHRHMNPSENYYTTIAKDRVFNNKFGTTAVPQFEAIGPLIAGKNGAIPPGPAYLLVQSRKVR